MGLTAWGIGCGGDGVPGVYADVGHAYKWVELKTSTKKFNMQFKKTSKLKVLRLEKYADVGHAYGWVKLKTSTEKLNMNFFKNLLQN